MTTVPPSLSPSRTTCASLLHELQIIWNEIGETESERDKMLLQLEQECLDIYRKRVEKTREYRAHLVKSLADSEAEITAIVAALGEHSSFSRNFEKGRGTLKDQISAIKPFLEDLRMRKKERGREFSEIQSQIIQICGEIAGTGQSKNFADPQVDENDLTVKRLGELKSHLKELQNEKAFRLQKVNSHLSTIHELSVVMSVDFLKTVHDVHPSLSEPSNGQLRSINNETLARLTGVINSLKQEKQQRLQKMQGLGSVLIDMWNLMDAPVDERKRFEHATSLISSLVDEVSGKGCLSMEVLEQTEAEVERLNILKASKMKELIFKRQNELEEIYKGVHMDVDSDAARQILDGLIDSGNVDLSDLLSSMDDQIAKANEQALSRKDILDKAQKWKFASEEEKWLDDYERVGSHLDEMTLEDFTTADFCRLLSQDENRYSAGRGAHKNLKRAEKARILVSKIPSMVESLTAKVKSWELEKGIPFLYDKAPLLNSLEEYTVHRQEREEVKRKSREQKRMQEQLAAEHEAIFGSRSATKKPLGQSTSANTMVGTPMGRRAAGHLGRHGPSAGKERRESGRVNNIIPVNYVALSKDDSVS